MLTRYTLEDSFRVVKATKTKNTKFHALDITLQETNNSDNPDFTIQINCLPLREFDYKNIKQCAKTKKPIEMVLKF